MKKEEIETYLRSLGMDIYNPNSTSIYARLDNTKEHTLHLNIDLLRAEAVGLITAQASMSGDAMDRALFGLYNIESIQELSFLLKNNRTINRCFNLNHE